MARFDLERRAIFEIALVLAVAVGALAAVLWIATPIPAAIIVVLGAVCWAIGVVAVTLVSA